MMETLLILASIGAVGLLASLHVYMRYQRDLQAARHRVAKGSQMIETQGGRLEFGEVGNGTPVLLIHGAGGGYDQGLLIGGLILGDGFRLIAPSRFGYLKSPLPQNHSIEAQAELFASLLAALKIDQVVVVALSAGGPSALQFARRHPERTAALVMVAAVSHTDSATAKDKKKDAIINRLIGSDFLHWLTIHAARASLLSLLGVSKRVQKGLTQAERAQVDRILAAMLPMGERVRGIRLDQSRNMPKDFPLADINVPNLVIHARDDNLVDWSHGQHVAAHIPGAEFMLLDHGGHFLAGRYEEIRTRIISFVESVTGEAARGKRR